MQICSCTFLTTFTRYINVDFIHFIINNIAKYEYIYRLLFLLLNVKCFIEDIL